MTIGSFNIITHVQCRKTNVLYNAYKTSYHTFKWSTVSAAQPLLACFVKNLYPECLRKISAIIGNGYCLPLMTLFNWRKLLIQRTLPSFLGLINEGDTHSLSCCGARTPILTRWLSSVLKVFNWIWGTEYGLECTDLAFGSMSMCTFFLCG